MSTLVKYSRTIIRTRINDIELFYYNDELKCIYNPRKNVYYIECGDMIKRSIVDAVRDSHNYKFNDARISTCVNLNNLVKNINMY